MRRWAIFFGLFMLVIIALADTGRLGYLGLVYNFTGGHWVGHFILFGLLSFVINWSVFEARPGSSRPRLAALTCLALAFFVGLEELSQRYFATRHSDLLDFVFSCLGVAFFAWLAVRLRADTDGGQPGSEVQPHDG